MQQKYYVYAHTRPDKNEIFYIGISKNLFRPFVFNKGRRNKIWYNIFLKNNRKIIVEILNEFNTLKEAQLKEIELIEKYGRIFNNTGTLANLAIGGEYSIIEIRKFNQYDLDGNFIKTWEKLDDILKEFKITDKSIYSSIENNRASKEFIWKFYKSDFPLKIESYRDIKFKKVYQFDKNLNFINVYSGTDEASLKTNVDQTSISSCLSKKRLSAGGFIWSYDKNISLKKNYLYRYDLSNNFIKKYINYQEALTDLELPKNMNNGKCVSITSIKAAATGKQHKAYNNKWKWVEEILTT